MKEWTNKYNSFNSFKALVHREYWKDIVEEKTVPPPVFLSIDPINKCNLDCKYCNAAESIKDKKIQSLSISQIDSICDLLSQWKTRAVCIAGGGEPLLNKNVPYLIESLIDHNIKVGLITNGLCLDHDLSSFLKCTWIGCSIDAGSEKVYRNLKNSTKDAYLTVLRNFRRLYEHKIEYNSSCELTYKYLIHPLNYMDIYSAIKNAKEWGFSTFHSRPGGTPWFRLDGKNEFPFTKKMIKKVNSQLSRARKDFEGVDFNVYGVVHKFNSNWEIQHNFEKCYAVLTNCFISPSGTIGLCCDRRGDTRLDLCTIEEALNRPEKGWGSDHHLKIMGRIQIKDCPRCTYSHINEIFENVLIKDTMLCDFI